MKTAVPMVGGDRTGGWIVGWMRRVVIHDLVPFRESGFFKLGKWRSLCGKERVGD